MSDLITSIPPTNTPPDGDPPADSTPPQEGAPPAGNAEVRKLELEIPESVYSDLSAALPEKFKGDPAKFVKSYIELEKKIGVGARPTVPDEYELDLPEDAVLPDELVEGFKEAGLSQEQAQTLAKKYAEAVAPHIQTQQIALEQHKMAQLMGLSVEEAVAEAKSVLEWAQQEPDGEALVAAHGGTASGILLLKELYRSRVAADPTASPGNKPPVTSGAERVLSSEQIMQLTLDPRYGNDLTFTAQVDKRIEESMRAEMELAKGGLG